MKRAAAAALALLSAACHRDDQQIRDGFTAAFDTPPVLAIAPCPDADAKLARLQPLFQLAMRAYKTVRRFDDPLPADLAADLMATPIGGSVSDYRCFLTDGTDRSMFMGTIAHLFIRKGEMLLAQGNIDDGWAHVAEGLAVYSGPRPLSFILYLGAGPVVRYIRTMVDRGEPPPAALDHLERIAAGSLLRRPDLCAGLRLEFLWQAYLPFYDVLAPLRPRVAERWGDRATSAFASMAENAKPGDLALWRNTSGLYAPLITGCLDPHEPPLAPLDKSARLRLTVLPRDSSVAELAPTTLDRLHQYGDLEDEFLLFFVDLGRRRLRLAGVPYDAAAVGERLLVPSLPVPRVSSWDGSPAAVKDDPAAPGGLIVTRGRMRQLLPPLPAVPSGVARR